MKRTVAIIISVMTLCCPFADVEGSKYGAFWDGQYYLDIKDVVTSLVGAGNETIINRITEGIITDGNHSFVGTSFDVARQDSAQYIKLYEPTSKGNKWIALSAPEDGFVPDSNSTYGGNETTYYWPKRRPTYGGGYMTLAFPGQNGSTGEWVYGLYATTPFSGLVKTSGTQVASAAVAGTDFISPTGSETLTNKAIVMTRIAGSGNSTLTSSQVSDTLIDNTGQHNANVKLTLPTTATGYSFKAQVGEGQSLSTAYWKFAAATSGTMCLDGVCGKSYIWDRQPVPGDTLSCATAYGATSGVLSSATLATGTNPVQVKTAAFTYDLDGTYYSKAAVDGTVPGDDVIPQGKYGAIALDIDRNGTISVAEATANATGYTTSANALAGLPTVASGKLRIGTVTVIKSDGAFTFGTTSLSAANVTAAYSSTAAYTKGYIWDCVSVSGKWETDVPAKEYHPTGNATITKDYVPFQPGYLIDNTLCTDNCTITLGFDCTSQNAGRSAVFMDDNATAPSRLIVRPSANNKILDYCSTNGNGVRIDKTDRSFLGLRCKQTGASAYNWVPYGQLGYHRCEE